MLDCPRITDPAQRLACFDAAVTPPKRGAIGNWWVKVAGVQAFQSRLLGQPD